MRLVFHVRRTGEMMSRVGLAHAGTGVSSCRVAPEDAPLRFQCEQYAIFLYSETSIYFRDYQVML